MTKAELIRKLARKAGVTDPEAKIFFEIFLQQCAFILNPGEAVNIKGLGFFKFKKGRIKSISNSSAEETGANILSDFIVYTPTDKASDENDDLIFNIPAIKETEYNVIDSYFSLSIGKPIIPLRGVKNTEFFIPPAGNELRRILESKVENILSRSEIIKEYIKGSEFLVITPEVYSANQFEISWDEVSEDQGSTNITHPGIEKISWDLGEDISRQIEEDAILDLDKEDLSLPSEGEGHVSWDFGVQPDVEPEITEFKKSSEPGSEKSETTEEKTPGLNSPKNFRRVQSLTNEHKTKEETEEDLSWNFGNQQENNPEELKGSPDFYSHYEESAADEDGFIQVPNKKRTYDIELSQREQEKLDSIIQEQVKEEQENQDTDATEGFYKDETVQQPKTASSVPQQKEYYSGRRSTPAFVIAITVIIVIGAALLLYLKTSDILNPGKEKDAAEQEIVNIKPEIIERTYDIPVTYPYSPAGDTISGSAGSGKLQKKNSAEYITAESNQKSEDKTIVTAEIEKKSGQSVTLPAYRIADGKFKKVKENLFREGNTYVVQLSSWKSKLKAQAEVSKLRNKGLAAFVEEVSIPGRGIWYRVKIGNFRNQSDAEKFLQ
jgi:nucleoid DNA-binding protein